MKRAPTRKGGGGRSWPLVLLALGMLLAGIGLGRMLSCRGDVPPPPRQEPAPAPKAPRRAAPPTVPAAPAPKPEPKPEVPGLPRLALVIDDLGYAPPELVVRLCAQPVPLTVAVLPYQEFTRKSAEIAHERGKEIMLHLPMEPVGFPGPGKDPGPNAIMASLGEQETRLRVRQAMADIPHVKGANNHMGSRITPDRTRMKWILEELRGRGHYFIDSRTEKDTVAFAVASELGMRAAQRRVFLDDDKAFPEMERQWQRALEIARKEGEVVIIGHLYPETVGALERLIPKSRDACTFVPASAVVRVQEAARPSPRGSR